MLTGKFEVTSNRLYLLHFLKFAEATSGDTVDVAIPSNLVSTRESLSSALDFMAHPLAQLTITLRLN